MLSAISQKEQQNYILNLPLPSLSNQQGFCCLFVCLFSFVKVHISQNFIDCIKGTPRMTLTFRTGKEIAKHTSVQRKMQ